MSVRTFLLPSQFARGDHEVALRPEEVAVRRGIAPVEGSAARRRKAFNMRWAIAD